MLPTAAIGMSVEAGLEKLHHVRADCRHCILALLLSLPALSLFLCSARTAGGLVHILPVMRSVCVWSVGRSVKSARLCFVLSKILNRIQIDRAWPCMVQEHTSLAIKRIGGLLEWHDSKKQRGEKKKKEKHGVFRPLRMKSQVHDYCCWSHSSQNHIGKGVRWSASLPLLATIPDRDSRPKDVFPLRATFGR